MKGIFAKIPPLVILGLLIAAGTGVYAQGPQNKGKSAKAIEKKEAKGSKAERTAGAEEKAYEMEKEVEEEAREAEEKIREAEEKVREAGQGVRKAEKKANEAELKVKEAEERVKEAQGNAYGKNKGDLSGREFGQARSAQAKMNNEGKLPENAGLSSVDAEKEARLAVREAKKAEKEARKAEKAARKAEKKAMKALKARKEKAEILPGVPVN